MSVGLGAGLELVTPSEAPDAAVCADLAASVARFGPDGSTHRLFVPRRNLARFRPLEAGTRTRVEAIEGVLPRSIRRIPGRDKWVALQAPISLVRARTIRQLVRLAASASSSAASVLLVDVDTVFVRPFSFAPASAGLAIYRRDHAVDGRRPKRLVWDRVAHSLLGLPARLPAHAHDYAARPSSWDPDVVREMLARVTTTTSTPWWRAVQRETHFSEMVLYGVYVDEVISRERRVEHLPTVGCSVYSRRRKPLVESELRAFLEDVPADDVAVTIPARSAPERALRRRLLAEIFG